MDEVKEAIESKPDSAEVTFDGQSLIIGGKDKEQVNLTTQKTSDLLTELS